jgi:hypothetical protein
MPKPVPVFELLDPVFGWTHVRALRDFRAGSGSWAPVSVAATACSFSGAVFPGGRNASL